MQRKGKKGKEAKRRDALFFHRIAKDKRNGRILADPKHSNEEIYLLFPSRKLWHSFRPTFRKGLTSVDLNAKTLFLTVRRLREKTPYAPWAIRLNQLVATVKKCVLDDKNFEFPPPRVIAVAKDRAKKTYRPIALFDRLEDKVIDCLTARYLREVLDPVFLSSCWAFRCRTKSSNAPTTHDALNKLLQLRLEKKQLYVAECDIRSFFDCVSHKVAIDSINELATLRTNQLGASENVVDERALKIFKAYLNSYSFRKTILNDALSRLRKKKDPAGEFPWPLSELRKFHDESSLDEIGVPQGGALSCLVANAVLHKADEALDNLCKEGGERFEYLRYCDDMILLAEQENICRQAFDLYVQELNKKCLPMHDPKHPGTYGLSFYDGKSHLPYRWGPEDDSIPWIQFVGYQIRHDGLVRIRLKSLKKELRKITSTADELIVFLKLSAQNEVLERRIRKSKRQIIHRFRQKLISMSVGRMKLGLVRSEPMPMCWASGFRGLKEKRVVFSSLKILDRHRERQIARVAKRLKSLGTPRYGSAEIQSQKVHKFYGHPFSYWGQFK